MWTATIPADDVEVNLEDGTAEMHIDNLALGDYTKIPISLGANFQTADVPATVSIDVVWSGPVRRRLDVTNGSNGNQYAGRYLENQVSVTWSASEAGFSFTANPGDSTTSVTPPAFTPFAELGHERNGSFFSSADEGDGPDAGSMKAEHALGTPLDGARLAPALTDSLTVPASTGSTLLSPPHRTDALAAVSVGKDQPMQPASAPHRLAASGAHLRVFDQVFADLDANTLPDAF